MRYPRSLNKYLRRLGLAGAVVALGVAAGCSSGPDIALSCPQAVAVADAARLVKFKGTGRDLTDVKFEAELENLQMVCDYDEDDHAIEADLLVRFVASRGPADEERLADIRYFVAVATQNARIVARQEFAVKVPFEGNRTRVAVAEELTPRIPLNPNQNGSEYRVFVGFSLTPEELDYNRRRQ